LAWHGINHLESMGSPAERWHQCRALNHTLLLPLIGGGVSHLHLRARSSHNLISWQVESWLVKN
jgi:hypothetical protein